MSIFQTIAEKLKETAGEMPTNKRFAYTTEPKVSPDMAKNTLLKVGNFAKDILQGTARSGGSIGLSLSGVKELKAEEGIAGDIQKFIFGKEPLESIGTRIEKLPERAKEFGIPEKVSKPFALPVILGLTALDFTGLGGESKVLKTLAQTNDIKTIAGLLKKSGVADDLLETATKDIAKITDTKQVKSYLDTLKSTTKGFDWKERGFISTIKEELPELKVAGQYVPRDTDRLAIKAKNLIKDNIDIAEKRALTETNDEAVATGAELLKHYSDEAARATDKAIQNTLYDKAAELGNTMARNLTEQGRSIQAASILGRLTPEGQIRFVAKEIQKYNEVIEKGKGGLFALKKKVPELTGEQTKYIETEMKAVNEMAEGEAKAIRFQKIQDYISNLIPSSLYKKIISVWKAGLLTGIKTSGLNIFSNVAHFGMETVKDLPAVAVDSVASLFTGERKIGLSLRVKKGIGEGFYKGWRYLKTGYDERNIAAKLDYRKVNFGKGKIAQGLQKYEESVFRVIGAEDQPFYYGAKAKSLADQAIAKSKNAGLKGEEAKKFIDNFIENPTDDMVKYAVLDAETAVYQNETTLGKIAKAIQKAPGGEIVVPFGRTPSAVATQLLNYSPVGIVKTITENIGKGRFDQRLFAQGIGRGLTGTAVLFLGGELFNKGMIELGRPTSEKERKLWELEGRKENSIKIGDKWRSVQILGPAGNLLLVGGYFKKEFDNSGSPTEAFAKSVGGSAKSFTEQTFLKGMSSTLDALTDPARSAEGWLGSTLSSSIPTIISDVARATDIKERRTETIGERFKGRIPGLRKTLEPQITVLGKEKERVGSFLEVIIDPTRPSKEITTPVIMELRRLWTQGQKVSPTLLGDKAGYKGLSQQENTELWKRAGEITENKLNNLLKSDKYHKLSDEEKGKIIDGFIDKSKLMARVETSIKLTGGLSGEQLKSKLSELKEGGLLNKEVYKKYQELR